MSASVTHKLLSPITTTFTAADGTERREVITELTFRKPKAKVLRVLDTVKGEVAQTIALIAAITGQPQLVIDELDPEDLEACGKVIEGFFPNSPRTGKRR